MTVNYIDIALYALMFLLAIHNIWLIFIVQKKYKNYSLMAFYIFAIITTLTRECYLVLFFHDSPINWNLDLVWQASKLCVGIVQDWITLELAIRVRNSKGYSNISPQKKKILRRISCVLFIFTGAILLAFSAAVIATARNPAN